MNRATGVWAPLTVGAFIVFELVTMPLVPVDARGSLGWLFVMIVMMLIYSFIPLPLVALAYARQATLLAFVGGAVLAVELDALGALSDWESLVVGVVSLALIGPYEIAYRHRVRRVRSKLQAQR